MVNPIDRSIKIMEKELEETLNSDNFLSTKDWKVDISFRGGFGEEWFNVSAYSSKLDFGANFDTYVSPDPDTDLTEKQYDKEVASLMELYLDDIGIELIDKLNEESN